MNEDKGVTGESPAPSQPSATTTTAPATAKKIDYGMGPQGSSSSQVPSAGTNDDMDDDTFYKTYGQRMFNHPRVKEALTWKKKYETVEPMAKIAEGLGGPEAVQEFAELLGPVYQYLVKQGDQASVAWGKLTPILQKFLNGEDFVMPTPDSEGGNSQDDDDPRYKTLIEENQKLKTDLDSLKQDIGGIKNEKTRERHTANVNKYVGLFNKKASDLKLPENVKKHAEELMIMKLPRYMPKDPKGNQLSPLDFFDENAFNDCFDKVVLAFLKDFDGYYKGKITKTDGGPSIPDTNEGGQTNDPRKVTYADRDSKTQRFAQFIKRGVVD